MFFVIPPVIPNEVTAIIMAEDMILAGGNPNQESTQSYDKLYEKHGGVVIPKHEKHFIQGTDEKLTDLRYLENLKPNLFFDFFLPFLGIITGSLCAYYFNRKSILFERKQTKIQKVKDNLHQSEGKLLMNQDLVQRNIDLITERKALLEKDKYHVRSTNKFIVHPSWMANIGTDRKNIHNTLFDYAIDIHRINNDLTAADDVYYKVDFQNEEQKKEYLSAIQDLLNILPSIDEITELVLKKVRIVLTDINKKYKKSPRKRSSS